MNRVEILYDNWAYDNLITHENDLYNQCMKAYIAGYNQCSEDEGN